MRYTSRGLRCRRNTDQWEVTLTHKDPISGEPVTTYHTVTAKTERQAQKKRDELIRELEAKGSAVTSKMTLGEFVDEFIKYKEDSKAVERSTVNDYRKEARVLKRYIGDVRLADVTMAVVSDWMASMTAEGYAPRTRNARSSPSAASRSAVEYEQLNMPAASPSVMILAPCDVDDWASSVISMLVPPLSSFHRFQNICGFTKHGALT